jgi:predicted permease
VTLLCGVLPALRLTRGDGAGALSSAGRAIVSRGASTQWFLVGVQVTFAVTLLAGAALLARSYYELSRVDAGFSSSGVLTFRVTGSYAETADRDRVRQRIQRTVESLASLPGVQSAATSMMLPGIPNGYAATFGLMEAGGVNEGRIDAEHRMVSPGYFATVQIPILAGERCADDREAQAMVNRAFVRRYLSAFPSALGLHLVEADEGRQSSRIVGIVGDARELRMDREPQPTVYSCRPTANPRTYFLVRVRGDPLAIVRRVRAAVKELEPSRSVYAIETLDGRIADTFGQNRLRTVLLSLFASTALGLACVGLYGTLSYAVSRRRREIGLRVALGSQQSGILQHFLGQAMRVAGVACVCGLALSLAVGRALSGMVYGVSTNDASTLTAVVVIVLGVATLAALVPAARAALVQPMSVLRED